MRIKLPNGWQPRPYQKQAWDYLEGGGRHAELIWHRRSGKDEICLHRTSVAMWERVATYWHMLPEYAQARKAIWDAVNPHSGKRRIDEAFPIELRAKTVDDEMKIVARNGSTWQVVGSDSYNRLVGAAPAGVVYSEWALANPAARAYLRPIIAENNGWQVFITTPRGKNHAYKTLKAARNDPTAFAQVLDAQQTGVFTAAQLEEELRDYINDYGEDQGLAIFQQEYLCSFDAAVLGAFYVKEIMRLKAEKRLRPVVYDEAMPVHTAWDIGRRDDTAIWFYQVVKGEVHVLKCHFSNSKDVDFYVELLRAQGYRYGTHHLPHDAAAKRLGTKKTVEEQIREAMGAGNVRILPRLSLQDGIQAARQMWPRVYMDSSCEEDLEALAQYRREYDEDKRCFKDTPVHDWTSHRADAFRYMAIAWREEAQPNKDDDRARFPHELTIAEIIKRHGERRAD